MATLKAQHQELRAIIRNLNSANSEKFHKRRKNLEAVLQTLRTKSMVLSGGF